METNYPIVIHVHLLVIDVDRNQHVGIEIFVLVYYDPY